LYSILNVLYDIQSRSKKTNAFVNLFARLIITLWVNNDSRGLGL